VYKDQFIELREELIGNYRASLGSELQVSEAIAWHLGASYTPSLIKETEERFGQDFWSVYTGAKRVSGHVETSLGFFYSLGKGEGDLNIGKGTTTFLYEYMGFFLGTNYRF